MTKATLNHETVNTVKGATDAIKAFSVKLASLFNYEDKYFATDITLEKNLVMELTNGKRGGANRLRVYLNKRNGLYAVSVRYGNNIVGHDAVINACKGFEITDELFNKTRKIDFTAHMDEIAKDGKTESRIQFMVSRTNDFIALVSTVLDETSEAIKDESVTA